MGVSVRQGAMSSCKRLAPRYKRDLEAAQAELRCPSEGVGRWSASDQSVSEQGDDRQNQVRHRASDCRPPIGREGDWRRGWPTSRGRGFRIACSMWTRTYSSSGVASSKGGKTMRHTFPQPDLFIAATAVLHDLCVVTRNADDFLLTEAPVLNPWTATEPWQTE